MNLPTGHPARQAMRDTVQGALHAKSIKLLNMASDWVRSVMPHVLSKINRVSFGLLQPTDPAYR
jgi:hypothetical protein